jgi:putative chitinase
MITKEILKKIAPAANDKIITDLANLLPTYLDKYGINTPLRVAHFIAQAAHEGRKDLGNTSSGDGKKYKGRGIFQLTGKANYTSMSKILGVDLVNKPELAKTAEISIQTACEYWNGRKLSDFADKDDVTSITKKINGGLNGFEDRKAFLSRAKQFINSTSSTQSRLTPELALKHKRDWWRTGIQ